MLGLQGEGTYRYQVQAPGGWPVVGQGGQLELHGDGVVSITLRVPEQAPAGETFVAGVLLFDEDGATTALSGTVRVARTDAIRLVGPDELTGVLGQPVTFEVVVTNEGNAPDTVRLTARHTHWEVRFDDPAPRLAAGESRVVRGTLRPTTTVNSGFRHIFQVIATPEAAPEKTGCDRDCLRGFAGRYMDALVSADPDRLKWADTVKFAENHVPMMIGDGLGGTISAKSDKPFIAADPETGNVVWMGWVAEHGQPAHYAMRLKVENRRIKTVETLAAREEQPGPFAAPKTYTSRPGWGESLP
jgi:hypothetical protein